MNREDNYYYNGSGYADPTAAAVIGKILREDKMRLIPKPYELWRSENDAVLLIVATEGKYIQYIKAYDEPTDKPGEIRLAGSYINPRFLAYGYADRSVEFMRMLNAIEIVSVKSAIADVFGITCAVNDDVSAEPDTLAAEVENLEAKNKELTKQIERQKFVADLLIEKLTEARCGKE